MDKLYGNYNTTKHEWCYNLDETNIKYISTIKNTIRKYLHQKYLMRNTNHLIDDIDEMDELYYSKPENNIGSDNVFITPHIDGFLGWIPFMRCWRCLYCITNPNNTTTYFPLNPHDEKSITLTPNNFVCHDYNRDLHWIEPGLKNNNETRVVLKLHFYDYSYFMQPFSNIYKTLNIKYNFFARDKFLYSINPYNNALAYLLSFFINSITVVGGYTEYLIGLVNISIFYFIYQGVYKKKYEFHCVMEYITNYICLTQLFIGTVPPGTFWRDLIIYKILSFVSIYKEYNYILRPSSISSFVLSVGIGILQYSCPTKSNLYYDYLNEFSKYHMNEWNIYFHLITSSLCYLGIFGVIQKYLLNKPYNFPYIICGIYWVSNKYSISDTDAAYLSTMLITFYAIIIRKYRFYITIKRCIFIFILGIILQELSHIIFNESTYLNSYKDDKNWIQILFLHTFWLIPFEIRTLLNLYQSF
tara:strand:- start:10207 stop:11619 length:1413 start_codon:yes stop_codon:yes gene_type:complete